MKKILMITAAAVLLGAAWLTAAEGLVIDNGQKSGNQASGSGWWYTYNDAAQGGDSTVSPEPNKFELTKDGKIFAARMKGQTGNKLGWDFIGMGVTINDKAGCPSATPVDLNQYNTLSFKIKGAISGGRLTVIIPYEESKCQKDSYEMKTLTDWADYETVINKSITKDWTTVKLDLKKDFKQPKWAKKTVSIEEVLKNAHNINWHFTSPDGDTVDISITDIELN